MKKILLPISLFILILVIASIKLLPGIFNNDDYETMDDDYVFTESELRGYVMDIVDFTDRYGEVTWRGCGVGENNQGYYVYMEILADESVDYEQYKETIYKTVGIKFPLEFEMVEFPDEPGTVGIIRKISNEDYRKRDMDDFVGWILVVSDENFINKKTPNASLITVDKSAEIVGINGEPVEFEELEVGMKIDSYYRGLVQTEYPGHEGTEKLVVYLDYERELLKDSIDQDLFEKKYQGRNLSKPYCFAAMGWKYVREEISPEYKELRLTMNEGYEYFDYDKDLKKASCYEGDIYMYLEGKDDDYATKVYIFGNILIDDDFELELEDLDDDGMLEFYMPYFGNSKWINKCYSISDMEIIRLEEYDRIK
jgi:hypothetical protein